MPTELEFEPIDGQRLSETPLGRIPSHYTDRLNDQFHLLSISSSTAPLVASINDDARVKDYRRRFRSLVGHLQGPATLTEALMTWRLAQVNYLELEARILWLTTIKPIFAIENSWQTHELRNVVGAVTDRLNTVEYLYRVCSICHCHERELITMIFRLVFLFG